MTHRKWLATTAVAIGMAALSGCRWPAPDGMPLQQNGPLIDIRQMGRNGRSTGTYSLGTQTYYHWNTRYNRFDLGVPANPRQLDRQRITLHVSDARGHTVVGYRAIADLSMPSMTMPRNAITLNMQKGGEYAGMCRFTMAGTWSIRLDVSHNGQHLTTYTIPITVH